MHIYAMHIYFVPCTFMCAQTLMHIHFHAYIFILSIFRFSAQVETYFENADADVLMHEHLLVE